MCLSITFGPPVSVESRSLSEELESCTTAWPGIIIVSGNNWVKIGKLRCNRINICWECKGKPRHAACLQPVLQVYSREFAPRLSCSIIWRQNCRRSEFEFPTFPVDLKPDVDCSKGKCSVFYSTNLGSYILYHISEETLWMFAERLRTRLSAKFSGMRL